jgi:hypothetical protein
VYIKIALKEIDWEVEDSIHLAQDRYKRWTDVNIVWRAA